MGKGESCVVGNGGRLSMGVGDARDRSLKSREGFGYNVRKHVSVTIRDLLGSEVFTKAVLEF